MTDISAAAAFINEHQKLQDDLDAANVTIADQTKLLDSALNKIDLQQKMLADYAASNRRYLSYCYVLSAQLKFCVAGVAQALQISANIDRDIASGADIHDADLQDLMQQLKASNPQPGDDNATALAAQANIPAPGDNGSTDHAVDLDEAHPDQIDDPTLPGGPLDAGDEPHADTAARSPSERRRR